jgi:hypothetical protein
MQLMDVEAQRIRGLREEKRGSTEVNRRVIFSTAGREEKAETVED